MEKIRDAGLEEVRWALDKLSIWLAQVRDVVGRLQEEDARRPEPVRTPLLVSEEVPPPGDPCGDGEGATRA